MIRHDGSPFPPCEAEEARVMQDAYRRVCALLIGQGGQVENTLFRSRIADIIIDLNTAERRGAEDLARAALQRLAPLAGTQARHA